MNIEDNLYFLGNKNQQFNTQIKQHHYYTIIAMTGGAALTVSRLYRPCLQALLSVHT
jgi:hypothetical protein